MQASLFDPPRPLRPSQHEILEAMRRLVVVADSLDIQKVLAEYGIRKDRNIIAKRLGELEQLGLVERVGHSFDGRSTRTTWRRK